MSGQFPTNGRWADFPQGYLFQADVYCPNCIIGQMPTGEGQMYDGWGDATGRMGSEEFLLGIAEAFQIDYWDEYSYDSDDFPKVITNEQGDGLTCGSCGIPLEEV